MIRFECILWGLCGLKLVRRFCGELAQLVERCDRTAEARGSNPLFSIFGTESKRGKVAVEALGSFPRVGLSPLVLS
jgi:hypothetical protein